MGWLHNVALLSVFFACSMCATRENRDSITGTWENNNENHHTGGQQRNVNSHLTRYHCLEMIQENECKFHDVKIVNSTDVHIGYDDLSFNNYTKISFKNSVIRKLPKALLDSFRGINVLDLSSLQIEEIEPFALTNGFNITELDMSFNDIQELSDNSFSNMRSLEVLYLDRNNLSSLPENIFSGNSNLTQLWIANNILSSIGDKTFKNNKKLKHLTLSSNKLTYINLTLIPSLTFGNVSYNLLTTLTIPVAVEALDASHNQINTVQGPDNANLKTLLLQQNNLTGTTWLLRYSGLSDLDLSHNELEKITHHHFKHLRNLTKLYLSNNRLTELNLGVYPIPSLKILDVQYNHLVHVEKNQKQFDILEQLYLNHNAIIKLKISSNNTLQKLTLSHNDLDCANLNEVFQLVNVSKLLDRDQNCKPDYQLKRNFCCKESKMPYLDRLLQYIKTTSIAEKLGRAARRCSKDDVVSKIVEFDANSKLLPTNQRTQGEINKLNNNVNLLEGTKLQFEQKQNDLRTEIDNTLRRYRVTKDGLVKDESNLRKVLDHLNSRRTFKDQESKDRLQEATRKNGEVEKLKEENKNLETKLTQMKADNRKIKESAKKKENIVKLLEAKQHNNVRTRQNTK